MAPYDAHRASSIGVRFDRLLAESRACWLTFDGSPLKNAPEIRTTVAEPLSADILGSLQAVERGSSTMEQRNEVSTTLTQVAIRLCQQLIAEASDSVDEILAIGIHGAGIWEHGHARERDYVELIQSTRIAELFGKTVIDDFPARDLAQGGCGGPVESHGLWILLADRTNVPGPRWRGLLDISAHVTHLSIIGPLVDDCQNQSMPSIDICVGSRLLAELVAFSGQRELKTADQLKIAAAGTVLPNLEEIWIATSSRSTDWNPAGVNTLPLIYALQNSIYEKAALPDLLATAAHFLAREIEQHVKYGVPAHQPIGELLVMGEGSKNAMIMDSLNELLPAVSIRQLSELGQDRTILASCVAALALLHIWQIPVPSTRGGEVPRVLGRITPGNPSNWQRVLHTMTSNAPWLLPLREAI